MKQRGVIAGTITPESDAAANVLPLGWTARHQIFFDGGLSLFLDGFVDFDEGTAIKIMGADEKDLTVRLMQLYKHEGAAFLKQLRGSFAMALWDAKARRLILAVDPFGTRPLFFW
jgi:hypothetical protein